MGGTRQLGECGVAQLNDLAIFCFERHAEQGATPPRRWTSPLT